jgi:branched-chain amino acid transport system substrate-binding protein
MRNIAQRRLWAFAILTSLLLSSAPAQAFQKSTEEPIKIGVFLDLSGPTSSFGKSTLNGINLAVDRINRTGGVQGRQLALFVEDDEGEPAKAANASRRLVGEKNVNALLGDVASSNTLAAAPFAQFARIPLLSPASTHPMITTMGEYIFRTCFIDPVQGDALAEFAIKNLKARRAAILSDSASGYSKSLTTAFEKRFVELGGRMLMKKVYAQADRDFTGQLFAIKATRPDVIFVPGYYQEAGVIAKQARQLGIRTPLLGGDGWDSPALWDGGGLALNGSFMASHYATDMPTTSNTVFTQAFKARYGMDPDALAALGYDAMNVLADAVRRAGGTHQPAFRDALATTRNFDGATGSITLNQTRDAVKPVHIMKLENQRFTYHTSVQPRQ